MKANFARFIEDESGAVTVDWVVLTAGIVALSIMVFTIITPDVVAGVGNAISRGLEQASQTEF